MISIISTDHPNYMSERCQIQKKLLIELFSKLVEMNKIMTTIYQFLKPFLQQSIISIAQITFGHQHLPEYLKSLYTGNLSKD